MKVQIQTLLILSCLSHLPAARGEDGSCQMLGRTWPVQHVIDIVQWELEDVSQFNFCQERCRDAALCVALTQRFLGNFSMQCILFRASIYYDAMVDCTDDFSGFFKCSRYT